MSERIDVLAVMDRYANSILPGKLWDGSNPYCVRPGFTGSDYSKDVADLIEARAAVAELIEAAKDEWLRSYASSAPVRKLKGAALARLDAALARIGAA